MSTENFPKLIKLKESDLAIADPAEDIRGSRVFDKSGEEIGKVDDLFVDEGEMKVRFLEVSSGGIFGIGDRKFLLPVDAIVDLDEDSVTLSQTTQQVDKSPIYDPKIVDETYLRSTYEHYGYPPYWVPGYVYPPFPFFRSQNRPRRTA